MIFIRQVQRSKAILKDLLRSDPCFKAEKKESVLHNTHAFATKIDPTLPRRFIEALTGPGELVLDPMCGSGTAVIEAALAGRRGMGLDFDPLAVKLSRMKTSRLDPAKVRTLLYRIVNNAFVSSLAAPDTINHFLHNHYSEEVIHFFRDWFSEDSILQLACLIREIQQIEQPSLRNFFEIIFSSMILTQNGGGVPPHHNKAKGPTGIIKFFLERGTHAMGSLQEFIASPGYAAVAMGDSRNLPLEDRSVDLVVTKPPYANAIDSVQVHRYSLYWLGADYYSLAKRRDFYIGTRVIRSETRALQQDIPQIVTPVAKEDSQTACILGQYLQDMAQTLCEMQRVLKTRKAAVLVVGPSTMEGITVPTHEVLGEIAQSVGFQLVGIRPRGAEYVIGLVKSS